MAGRIRTIKPELIDDKRVAGLSAEAFRLFIGSICLADDHGIFRAEPRYLKGHIFSERPNGRPIESAIAELEQFDPAEGQEAGLWVTYSVAGQRYGCLYRWGRHQRVSRKAPPRLPMYSDSRASEIKGLHEDLHKVALPDHRPPSADHRSPSEILVPPSAGTSSSAGESVGPAAQSGAQPGRASSRRGGGKGRGKGKGKSAAFQLPAELPAALQLAAPPRAADSPTDPLSTVPVDKVLDVLAEHSAGRFVRPSEVSGEARINLARYLKGRTMASVRVVAEYLAAGGDAWRGQVTVANIVVKDQFFALFDLAQDWNARGRPDPLNKPSARPAPNFAPRASTQAPNADETEQAIEARKRILAAPPPATFSALISAAINGTAAPVDAPAPAPVPA